MEKLLELEKKLLEAKAELSKIMSSGTTQTGSVNSTGGPSIASQIGFGKEEDKKEEDEEEKKKKEDLEKAGGPNKFGEKQAAARENIARQARQPAKDVIAERQGSGKVLITPEEQVKAQVDAKAAKKAKFEAEAKARRAEYRKQGLVKEEDFDSEVIKFDANGQWSLDKAVRDPMLTSPSTMENPTNVEGAAKDKKYQGGDPRHTERSSVTRAGNQRDMASYGQKKHSWTSGSSTLRAGTKLDDYERKQTNTTDGKKVDWKR